MPLEIASSFHDELQRAVENRFKINLFVIFTYDFYK